MTFGALEPCEQCKGGQFVFNKLGYICQGDLSEWAKCNTVEKKPKRRPFKVPKDLAGSHSFLKKYKYVPRDRVVREVHPTNSLKGEKKEKDDPDGDK